jgi:hypothetical protein
LSNEIKFKDQYYFRDVFEGWFGKNRENLNRGYWVAKWDNTGKE